MKLGATRKIRRAPAAYKKTAADRAVAADKAPAADRTIAAGNTFGHAEFAALTWTDELLSQSTELRTTLAGLGISRGQCDQLFQDVAGQFRARMPSAAELRASIDADRLSGKVGIPVSVVRSAVAALARILEGKAGPMGAPTAS